MFKFPETVVGVTEIVFVKLPAEVPQLKIIDVVASPFAFTIPFRSAAVDVMLDAD